jgi:hypothetical protein
MTQFGTLIWLKWTLFRNSLRSRKAVVSRIASALGALCVILLALLIAVSLGFVAYFLVGDSFSNAKMGSNVLILFTIVAGVHLMWATLPLSFGGASQFDPGRLLLYPVSLRKLFLMDFLSELTSLGSIYGVPITLGIAIGAGLGSNNLMMALGAGVCGVVFGLALSKFLSICIGALLKKGRSRGETLVALAGASVGLLAAFAGQLIPVIAQRGEEFRGLRWTPPGALAVALTKGLHDGDTLSYMAALATLALYSFLLITATYLIARRMALGVGGAKRHRAEIKTRYDARTYAGWQLPFLSNALSAIVEKELRYSMRNAQLRTLFLMPVILLGLKFMQSTSVFGGRSKRPSGVFHLPDYFALYGEGLLAAAGVFYIFMVLSSFSCNVFAYEEGGMRTLVLAPVERRTILIGKNIAIIIVVLIFSVLLLAANQIIFRDLTWRALLFTFISFPLFAVISTLMGNWLSIYFPKGMKFGKRMNVSGVAGLLLFPMMLMMMAPPVVATVAGYLAQSLVVKYATLLAFTGTALLAYALLIKRQGRALERRELEILETIEKQG